MLIRSLPESPPVMLDYLIIGKGLAGSLVAYELLEAGQKVLVMDADTLPSSSQVAGGMFNPVTGRHLAKTWLADELFPFLKTWYSQLQATTNDSFFYQTGLYRPFVNEKQRDQFLELIEKHALHPYIMVLPFQETYEDIIRQPLGGLSTTSAGWVDVPVLLTVLQTYFLEQNAFVNEGFEHADLQIREEKVVYKNYEAKHIIFCEGFFATKNPLFSWLPFNPVKGETLLIESNSPATPQIINQGSWAIPTGGGTWRIGATYSWHELDFEPTDRAKEQLQEKIARFFVPDYIIRNQQAGVRPSTIDRRPIIGSHPLHDNVFIFNGLGTKGVSVAPYFARQFRDFLLNAKELNPETTIERFYPLY